jgi:signal transduction histidine kinase
VQILNFKYYWQNSDFFGRASLLFRYSAYLFNAIYLIIFINFYNVPLSIWHGASFVAAIFLPYFVFVYYVNRDNDKGVGIRQNMVDFFFVGWLVGLIHLLYIPSFIFIIGLVSNYIASRGFHKFYRVLVIPAGYLCTIPIFGFQFETSLPSVMLHLTLTYGLIHFISIAYISYRFSKNVQMINRKVINQQKEILTQTKELQSLNEELKSLNNHLEDKVVERTNELQLKNEKLAEYTFINGHQLRAPVATMLGLCNLLEYAQEVSDKEEIISKVKGEVEILNITIKEIRLKLETDQTINDKVKEVETEHSHFEKLRDKIQKS